ncbi:MAG: 4Fe-4S dicluster domain-containing protein, partial [Thermodesulfobacteriota bacterium]
PARQGPSVVWKKADQAKELLWEFSNTDMSPKSFFFPQTECLMHFKNDTRDSQGMVMQEEQALEQKQALLGIRPCDAKAFVVLDRVFCRDETSCDPYWQDKREKTLLIGLACKDPCPTCFCTAVHCGPHNREGLDMLMIDLGEQVLLKGITPKGEEILSDFPEADKEQTEQAREQKEQAERSIASSPAMDNIESRKVLELYESGMWDRMPETCINCGICTFYCPVCHCFDIQDENQGDYGQRIRNWDTCMSWLFTQHTSGHNPRGTKKDRVRQRFMHKFKYMPIKLAGALGCVGCGRCTQKCPVNIDVREVINQMNQEAAVE